MNCCHSSGSKRALRSCWCAAIHHSSSIMMLLCSRYRVPKTAKQLLEEFDAAHTSIHSHVGTRSDQQQDGGQQHEQQQQPVAVQGAAETTACSAKRQDKDSSPDQVHKRQCLQHITHSTPVAGTQKQKDHQILDITCRNRMGEDVIFKVNWDCRLGKLMKAYSLMKPDVEWRFIFNGCLIDPNLTPWSYDMEDGDTIDVVQVQYGD
eukprot:GHUV01033609.1.p1 GENE.GHUV01033609.1~~GHUV01033609.1.p1  ORF type:complete len:206 (+),score=50.88 GHUV01033609.1:381-998(+)